MVTLWIGDFRTKQIQQYLNKNESASSEHSFLIDDLADYEWFINDALVELPLVEAERADVVVALGFNDCVYSCTWNSFSISQLAVNYINKFNALVNDYPGFNFYFCSVNPVNADYPFAEYPGGTIQQSLLNSKIVLFNNTIKNLCAEHYIDTYNYLTSTGFETRDGVRFQGDTILHLQKYITGQFKMNYSTLSAFVPRFTAPNINDESIIYWKHKDGGQDKQGFNPCIEIANDLVLPNCVGYAWGRFMEILESTPNMQHEETTPETDPEEPNLSTRHAGTWYGPPDGSGTKIDGYERGNIPRLGAVACWSKTGGYGHVAIVEEIKPDGSIVMSESNYRAESYNPNNSVHFGLRTGNSSNKWGIPSASYTFQGFIYNPKIPANTNATTQIPSSMQDYVPKAYVESAGNKYFGMSEMQINARYIWQYLGSRGWTLNAVAGLLGNIQTESTMNPLLLEKTSSVAWPPKNATVAEIKSYADSYKRVKGRFPGFGLTQWTSTEVSRWEDHKFIKWCNGRELDPRDIDSQLERLIYERDNGIQFYRTNAYPLTFKEFSVSTQPASYLGKAFLKNYERPANPNYEKRGQQSEYWYNYLLSYTPTQVVEPALSLENTKVKAIEPTKVDLSFVVRSGSKGSYRLLSATGRQLNKKNFNIGTNDGKAQVMSFSINNLTPNTIYGLEVEVIGTSEADKATEKITFITAQDLPSPVTSLTLVNTDTKFPPNSFKLTTGAVSDWGYWKKNTSGYIIQLIVNGKCISEKTIQNLPSTLNFKISNYFTNYESKLGDTIQIGVRTWVTDDNGNKQYDSFYAKTSNTICFLKQLVVVYLNDD